MSLRLPVGRKVEAVRHEFISPKVPELVAGWLLETMVTG